MPSSPASESGASDPPEAHKPSGASSWQLGKRDWTALGAVGTVVCIFAAIVQVAESTGGNPVKAIVASAVILCIGAILVVAVARIWSTAAKKLPLNIVNMSLLLFLAVIVGGGIGYLISASGVQTLASGKQSATQKGSSGTGGSGGQTTGATSAARQTSPATGSGMRWEVTDNRLGTQVFASPLGTAVAGNDLIPFDTRVQVKCWAKNESGMVSINAFYLIETTPWTGDYAPANTFANGDPIGQPGSTAIDSAVRRCH